MRTPALLLTGMLLFEHLVPVAAVAEPLPAGTRIRLTGDWSGPPRRIGSFLIAKGDSIWIQESSIAGPLSSHSITREEPEPDTTRVGLPLTDVRKLEISRGLHHDGGKSAIVGALGGAGLGLVVGALAYDPHNAWLSRVQTASLMAVTFGFSGLVLGGLVSLTSREEFWQRVPVSTLREATPADRSE